MKKSSYPDYSFQRFVHQIPQEILNEFNEKQLETLFKTFELCKLNPYPLNIRVSIPIPGLRFSIVLSVGSEHHSKQRLKSQKCSYRLWTPGNILFIVVLIAILLASSFTIASAILPSFSSILTSSFQPTVIPFITNEFDCKHSGRTWNHGECWDDQHSPMF